LDDLLFFAPLILVFIVLPIGLGLLLYFIPKKLGYPKTAKYLVILYSVVVLAIVGFIVFEDQFFTKGDAKELVQEQGFLLHDDFELTENKTMWSISDYYHTFTLKISPNDRVKAIESVKSSIDFKKIGEPTIHLQYDYRDRYNGPKRIQNYETESAYVREYFKPSGKEGYGPTYRSISISKTGNELKFEDMD
jgi:hypothetical protein